MILDAQAEFSDAQAVTSTANSTNVIDLINAHDIGPGEEVRIVCQVDTAATAAGAATVTFAVETGSTTSLGTNIQATSAIGKATLVAGYEVFDWVIPAGVTEQYLGISYTVATGPLTAGNFSAFIVKDSQQNTTYVS